MENAPLTFGEFIMLAGLFFSIVFGAFWVFRYLNNRFNTQKADLENEIKALSKRVEEIRSKGAHELSEFKIKAAEEYATHDMVEKVKDEVVAAINRLAERLDNVLDRSVAPASRRRKPPT